LYIKIFFKFFSFPFVERDISIVKWILVFYYFDQLARTGSEQPFIGPEPACGISIGVAKKAIRDWKNTNHKKH
jgi:hypothetical protein